MPNKQSIKYGDDWYDFITRFRENRVKSGLDVIPLCKLPTIIIKYFKQNNDRYLELVNMELDDGDK